MSRYIDADELIEIFKILKWDASCSIVEDMPTADVVPMDFHNKVLEVEIKKQENLVNVVHGRWIEDRLCTINGGTYGVRRCSVCEDYYQDVGYGWNYCPNCGARMDERRNDDNG